MNPKNISLFFCCKQCSFVYVLPHSVFPKKKNNLQYGREHRVSSTERETGGKAEGKE